MGRAIQAAVRKHNLPEGVFSLIFGAGTDVGKALVEHPTIQAVGFTGSRAGGIALMKAAAARPQPIPVYAEMSSINPVFLMPAALGHRAATIGKDFVGSLTLGAGQFCTNPGLVLAVDGPDLDTFLAATAEALNASVPATMLTAGIHRAFVQGVERLSTYAGVTRAAQAPATTGPTQGSGVVFTTDAATFLGNPHLREEIFGSASLIVRCPDVATMLEIARGLEGQLTATLQMDAEDNDAVRPLLPILEKRVGRILVNGYPTGVEVNDSMVHGGPFPATSDGRTTSVGTLAIRRFLRPVAYQNFPDDLLPTVLKQANTLTLWRRHDGVLSRD